MHKIKENTNFSEKTTPRNINWKDEMSKYH